MAAARPVSGVARAWPALPPTLAHSSLLPGIYVWGSTVLIVAWSSGGATLARACAVVSGLCLLLGHSLGLRPAWRQALGLHGFVGFSLLTWLLIAAEPGALRLPPGQVTLGGLGWMLFALSTAGDPLPEAPGRLQPRPVAGVQRRWLQPANRIFVVLVLAALLPWTLSWTVAHDPRAALAHIIACIAALIAFGLAAGIATSGGKWQAQGRAARSLVGAWAALGSAIALFVLGMLFKVFQAP